MTTPLAHDHPDYQRTVSATDIQVATASGAQGGGTVDHGTFFVGNLPYVYVFLSAGGGGARLRLIWRDAIGGNVLGDNMVDVLDGMEASGGFAVLGPFVQVTTLVSPVNTVVGLRVWQNLTAGQEAAEVSHTELIHHNFTAVAAGVTQTTTATRVRWGWGFWNSDFEAATAFSSQLRTVDYQGNIRVLDFIPFATRGPSHLITLPPLPLRLTAFNGDAVARNLFAVVHFHPGPW